MQRYDYKWLFLFLILLVSEYFKSYHYLGCHGHYYREHFLTCEEK